MKIYSSREEAQEALNKLSDQVEQLEEEAGATLECDDTCVDIYYKTQYYNPSGVVCELCL